MICDSGSSYNAPPGQDPEADGGQDAPRLTAYLSSHRGDMPIVLDAGCSVSVTPVEADFVSEITPTSHDQMHGLRDSVDIAGIGYVEWTVRDVFGRVAIIRTKAYYIPQAQVRLCSTQTYFQENQAGSLTQDHEKVILTTAEKVKLTFPYQGSSNIPVMYLDLDAPQVGMTGRQVLELSRPCAYAGDANEDPLGQLLRENHNLSPHAKELLLWHQRLGHAGLTWVQTLMRSPKGIHGEPLGPADQDFQSVEVRAPQVSRVSAG